MDDHAARIRKTVNAWGRKRRISGLPVQGKNACPGFQFNADRQPLTLMEQVPRPCRSRSRPGRAFWLVSQKESLDGNTPVEASMAGDDRVIQTARGTGDLV